MEKVLTPQTMEREEVPLTGGKKGEPQSMYFIEVNQLFLPSRDW